MEPMVNIALRAARNAGRVILRAMDRVDTLTIEEKGRNDLVSEIDRQAEDVIVDTILRTYPDHGILGEERGRREPSAGEREGAPLAREEPSAGEREGAPLAREEPSAGEREGAPLGKEDPGAEYTWVIDPLDGTTNFLHGIPHFCTAIAVTRGAALLHGVVVDHVRNEEFSASRGTGALLNGRRIRVARRDRLDDAIVGGGLPFGSVAAHLDAYCDVLRDFMGRCRTLRRQGAAALDLAYVASGRLDGFFEIGLKPWDMAAGAVIVREAGGFVGDAAGGDRFMATGNVVAANPKVFRDMLRVIRKSAADHADANLAEG